MSNSDWVTADKLCRNIDKKIRDRYLFLRWCHEESKDTWNHPAWTIERIINDLATGETVVHVAFQTKRNHLGLYYCSCFKHIVAAITAEGLCVPVHLRYEAENEAV